MRNYIIYSGILGLGLLLGWFLFGGKTDKTLIKTHNTTSKTHQKWTCSMHPQIQKTEKGDCPICGMDLILSEIGSTGLSENQFKLTENAIALANVETTIVGKGNFNNNVIKLSGKIAQNEKENTVQISYFSGRIEKLNVNSTGEKIQKGQLLATIYSPELYAAQQELISSASLKKSQPTLYNAVRNKLKLWKLSETQINKIETSGKIIENFPIYATVSGTVTKKLIEQGAAIKKGQPLLKISNLSTVWANFDVFENQIDKLKQGQEILITSNAYPNIEFNGKVDFIDPVLNIKVRTITLRTVLNNKDNLLKPGMFVEGKIKGLNANKKQAISIPSTAILWTGKRSVVYLKTNPNQPIFEMRQIVLGNHSGDNYEVLEGLNNGDEIVTNGTFTIDAAAQLQGKKSMMNKKDEHLKNDHKNHTAIKNSKSNNSLNSSKSISRVKITNSSQKNLEAVYNSYINLKDALVEEDITKIENSSKDLLKKIALTKITLDEKNNQNLWISQKKEIIEYANFILKTSDLNEQRKHFKPLSSNLINVIQMFGINEKVFVQFCPMAINNNGAYWLSKQKEVLNPYFGDAMLKCGEVKLIID